MYGSYKHRTSGISRQLFNWVQVIESNHTGGCIKLVEVYYSIDPGIRRVAGNGRLITSLVGDVWCGLIRNDLIRGR